MRMFYNFLSSGEMLCLVLYFKGKKKNLDINLMKTHGINLLMLNSIKLPSVSFSMFIIRILAAQRFHQFPK